MSNEALNSGLTLRILDPAELPAAARNLNVDTLDDSFLMAHQVAWNNDPAPIKVCAKGRRTGITFASALDKTIVCASGLSAGGDNVYYIGDTKEKGLEFIGYCAHFAQVMAMAMANTFHGIEVFLFEDQQTEGSKYITAYRIRFASGFQIVALSSNPANIRGLQGIVVIDEAAFHPQVQLVLDSATALLIWGGKIEIISTHNGFLNPFNELLNDIDSGLLDYSLHRYTFDDAVHNGLYEKYCQQRDLTPSIADKKAWYQRIRNAYRNREAMLEELDAIPRHGVGAAIPAMMIEALMKEARPIIRLSLSNDFLGKSNEARRSFMDTWIAKHLRRLLQSLDNTRPWYLGEDYARNSNFTVFAPGCVNDDLTRYVPFLVELHNVPTRQQEQILWHLIRHLPNFNRACMDATGNGATLAEYTADEFGRDTIEEIKLNDAWYRAHMGSFVDSFTDRKWDLPRDKEVKADLAALQLINGVYKLPKKAAHAAGKTATKVAVQGGADTVKQIRHGDAAIALAMLWVASLNSVDHSPPKTARARIFNGAKSLLRGYQR